jgi:hypothetical protein
VSESANDFRIHCLLHINQLHVAAPSRSSASPVARLSAHSDEEKLGLTRQGLLQRDTTVAARDPSIGRKPACLDVVLRSPSHRHA